ncbi:MAG: glycosyltransferase [Ferrovum sp.]|jgi:GT2 family glycosyltransferase|uniref:glycosyltransferase family 2 protein n=1 Tax=Ferrovum sp. TaxID=2609467 RepID=UPI002603F909|nr:glycosyltransferase family 2 protein [Ferrovum sp.]MBW8066065.1 glycosyltransferase [Ferrovum sp.]
MGQVSAILVNYFSADLIIRAVHSLCDQKVDSEILVVDNSLDPQEAELLRTGIPEFVKLRINTTNTGFGGACNQAYAEASGESILLLNPDAYLLPDALGALEQALQGDERVAAVGPRTFWDAEQQFLMPPSTFPSLADYCGSCLARSSPFFFRWRSRHFSHWACRYWSSDAPLSVPALSGGHVLLKRAALEKAGGLFDERFFLYWEDTDLMQRLRAAGYDLRMIPAARAVHEYTHSPEKSQRIAEGWPTYYHKHLAAHPLVRWLERGRRTAAPGRASSPAALEASRRDNGDLVFSVPVPWQGSWLLEISVNGDFVPAIGHWGAGERALLPLALQERLAGQALHVRLSAPGHSGQGQYWQSGS